MREVIFYLAMIIEIAYVFMSQVPKKLENKYLLIGTAFICASDFTYHIGYAVESGRERTTLTDSRIKLVLSDRLFKSHFVRWG